MNSYDIVEILLAIVIAVPIAKRLKLGAVLGYLIAGVLIGPQVLGLIDDPSNAATISEFGVVLMLFVIGLELSPQRLWVMRRSVFGSGLLQVVASTLLIGAIAYFGFGLSKGAAVIIGGSLALSSTAFGLQVLAERKEAGTAYGRQSFAILLFQDLAAIPLLAAVPLLAAGSSPHGVDLPAIARVIGAILVVVVGGRYLLRPVFRFVARARAVEASTATALLVVAGAALIMDAAGASVTLGAFLAGMLLADSEYRHELESNLEPFKGLLLGLFFISVGMSMQTHLLLQSPLPVLGLTLGLLIIKGILLWPLGISIGRLSRRDSLRLAALLASGGEFAFVVLQQATDKGLLAAHTGDLLVLAITLSMALTPPLVAGIGILLARHEAPAQPEAKSIEVSAMPRVILAGYGRVGQIVARILRMRKIPFVALDNSIEQLDLVQKFGHSGDLFYGDPARPELLRAAQADKADVFVIAADDADASLRVARVVRRMYPHLKIIARARNRQHVWRLMDLGVEAPVRETFYSSLKMSRQMLEALGLEPDEAASEVERFRRHDLELLKMQYPVYDDEAKLRQTTREAAADLNRLFEADAQQADAPIPPADADTTLLRNQ